MEKCCSECSEPRMAQSLCTFCNKWLCFQCTDLHQHDRSFTQPSDPQQREIPSPSEIGASCCGHAVVTCPLHTQEPLEVFCETCDLVVCSICHLSAHKDHRLVHVGKALQDQRWLLQNLMARVEEKRSTVESTAKQIQGRLHDIKVTQKKAENQIKMAKMIMMNELNKRANLLIEQLESISSDFKQRLEDQLQGVIKLCSQLEHVQNFITWASAHHRRNPLLFSKELIALQMQQLLEPLMLSDSWAPLKIKFNWDSSFWTKQMSTVGQLLVEGGSRSYSEVIGHAGILRPQPVPCIAVPPLCHAVREPGCTYQTFCQPQLCCLHCRPTQPVPLDKYSVTVNKYPVQCPQAISSPPSLHSCWVADASVPNHPLGTPPVQQSSSHPGSNPVQQGTSAALPCQPANSYPLAEPLHANSSQTVIDRRRCGQTSETATVHELTPGRELSLFQSQAQMQPTAETSHRPMVELQPVVAHVSGGRRSSTSELHVLVQGQAGDDQSHTSLQTTTVPQRSPIRPTGPCKDRLTGDAYSQATEARDQRCIAQQQVRPGLTETEDAEMIPGPKRMSHHSVSSLTAYKSEPDRVCGYEKKKLKNRKKNRVSLEDTDASDKEGTDGSHTPVGCLEQLKMLMSQRPPQTYQSSDLLSETSESVLKPETSVLERRVTSQGTSGEMSGQAGVTLLPTEQPSIRHLHSCGTSSSLEVPQPAAHKLINQQPDTEEIHSDHDPPSEPRSVGASDIQTDSTREAELGSDADVDSELQPESDPSAESELHAESEFDASSEQLPESTFSTSEQEFESDPDSTPEVTLNLEPESECEAEQEVPPPDTSSETESEAAVEHEAAEERPEIENEDFCAVCLIGGDLLCCDRCPKVFHLSCHVPPLHSFPIGDWICTLCRDVEQPEVEYNTEHVQMSTGKRPYGLSACDQRQCEKLTLLILSNHLSAPFHEPVSPLARHYYQIIKKPMDLSVIRNRLSRSCHTHYRSPQEFVADVLLMFRNCAKFNYPDSEVAQAGRSLLSFFTSQLKEIFPHLSCPAQEEDSDSEDYEELERAEVTRFPWPERKEQSHGKRKRRRTLNGRRNHY